MGCSVTKAKKENYNQMKEGELKFDGDEIMQEIIVQFDELYKLCADRQKELDLIDQFLQEMNADDQQIAS